jgi:hypothetical protein
LVPMCRTTAPSSTAAKAASGEIAYRMKERGGSEGVGHPKFSSGAHEARTSEQKAK